MTAAATRQHPVAPLRSECLKAGTKGVHERLDQAFMACHSSANRKRYTLLLDLKEIRLFAWDDQDLITLSFYTPNADGKITFRHVHSLVRGKLS
ncbi:hypothetical protein M8994_19080 [Brucella sp. 21LCYQ03]|nr:hypothetical protein [Brucella sp. 21LCYQ03]